MDTTAMAVTAIIKDKDVWVTTEVVLSLIFSENSVAAEKLMLKAMTAVWCVRNDDFCSFYVSHERQGGKIWLWS